GGGGGWGQLPAGHWSQLECEKLVEPLLIPVCHMLFSISAMSSLPSPLKSPTIASVQLTAVLHRSQGVKLNELLPVLSPTHHRPVCSTRPTMSSLPSPLKSPTLKSTQVTVVGKAAPQG